MYKINGYEVEKVESVTLSSLNLRENYIEEILRRNIDMLCDDEESMLVIGQQVRNEGRGISDLTAIDNDGNLVLIEIKRDSKDIKNRREAFEFQAIRYAASYATIDNSDKLVEKVYAPYIKKHRDEFEFGELNNYELGARKINEFLTSNNAVGFNNKQRIILVASDYDEQTLSAVAWLNNNNVDISCYKLIPYNINEQIFFDVEKVLPVSTHNDYYVNIVDMPIKENNTKNNRSKKRSLPKIDKLLEWGAVNEGDIIVARGTEYEGKLLGNGSVLVNGEEKSLQSWLKEIYGWSSVQTYSFSVHKDSGKTLSRIREEYMEMQDKYDDN